MLPQVDWRPADQRIIATYFAIVIAADPLLACGFVHLGADRKLSAFSLLGLAGHRGGLPHVRTLAAREFF
jgi:hypothetical protein